MKYIFVTGGVVPRPPRVVGLYVKWRYGLDENNQAVIFELSKKLNVVKPVIFHLPVERRKYKGPLIAGHRFATLPHDVGARGRGGDDVDRREGRRGREQSAQEVVRADENVPHGQVRSMNLERSITRPLLA